MYRIFALTCRDCLCLIIMMHRRRSLLKCYPPTCIVPFWYSCSTIYYLVMFSLFITTSTKFSHPKDLVIPFHVLSWSHKPWELCIGTTIVDSRSCHLITYIQCTFFIIGKYISQVFLLYTYSTTLQFVIFCCPFIWLCLRTRNWRFDFFQNF